MTELTTQTFDQTLTDAKRPVLVDFYAPWCGPCKMLSPMLNKMAETYQGRVDITKVNIDEAPELAARYSIRGVPTLMLFQDGKALDTIVGLPSASALQAKLDEVAGASKAV